MDELGHIKVTDFGSAKRPNKEGKCFSMVGDLYYSMPELLCSDYRNGYNAFAADWYGFGCCLFVMACGEKSSPFSRNGKDNQSTIYERMENDDFQWPKARIMQNMFKRFVKRLLTFQIGNRLTDDEKISYHGYFVTVDWELVKAKKYPPPFKVKVDKKVGKCEHYAIFPDVEGGIQEGASGEELGYVENFG